MSISQELTTYRETAVRTASPIELVIMLCDALVREMKLAAAAIRAGDVEVRVKHSNNAFTVLQELDLMLDFENGGETAKELAKVYSHVRAKLMEAQIKLDPAIIERQVEFIQEIRQAWHKALTTAAPVNCNVAIVPSFVESATPYSGPAEQARSFSWSA